MIIKQLQEDVLNVSAVAFDDLAIKIFQYQAKHNPLYKQYIQLLGINPNKIKSILNIPFLPIQFFKNHIIQTNQWNASITFTSSGTTSETTSRHLLFDPHFYQQISAQCFEQYYGSSEQYCFLALLPSYLERQGSSLVYMVDHFIKRSKFNESGFFLDNFEKLINTLQKCQQNKTPTVLIGVSFALLDLAEKYQLDLSNIIIMETGGMKGRRAEIVRNELHNILENAFNTNRIHSEYGMTELFSQAYSKGKGIFHGGVSMKVLTREINDPFSPQIHTKTGLLNIIDLGNLHTCSFIATDDLGRSYSDGSFEVLGRLDFSDIRGCNLLYN